MIRRLLLLLILIFSFAQTGWAAQPAWAQPGIQVSDNQATSDYPINLTFQLQTESNSPIDRIYLIYGTNARGCADDRGRQAIEIQPDSEQSVEWVWDFFKSGSLPPGAQVWWQWEIHDASGAMQTTEKQNLEVYDPHFDWKTLEKDNVLVYWVEGGQGFGTLVMNKALSSLKRLAEDAGVSPSGKIRLTIYPNTRTLVHAGLYIPGWAGGVAYPEYNSIIIGIPPGATRWANEVIPHELAHLVSEELVFNCMGVGLPTWLAEGLSVYSEAYVPPQDLDVLNEALDTGDLPALISLTVGFSGDQDRIRLNYIQSGQVVYYLVENYGPEKLAALLAAIQRGNSIDGALQQVYGFDTDGLDRAWRASLGFESAVQADVTPVSSAEPTMAPTLPLWTPEYVPPTSTPVPSPTLYPTQTAVQATQEPEPTTAPDSHTDQASAWPWLLLAGLGGMIVLLALAFLVWLILRSPGK
jgi:hypothetical protein